ncbi:MAG TPA: SDR family NAD(P)-dependent oxidoreductase, partial [Actinophytocola sp.]|uniref:SDR family NAD(P)-dependent oxidoreductase n=1 Tax=Actinophytocola sp. TaxID=1872138 RepID=UPI002F95E40C
TTHAFHSRMLEPVRDELTEWVRANVTLNAPQIPYISNVTGTRITTEQATNPANWARHMCQTVQFATAIDTLLADEELAVVEIGPGQSLGALIRGAGCPPPRWPLILSTLPGGSDTRPDDAALTDCLARLWLCGVQLDWTTYHHRHEGADAEVTVDPAVVPNRIPLPTYSFQRQRYWIEASGRPAPAPSGLECTVGTSPNKVHVEVMRPDWTDEPVTGDAAVERCVVFADAGGVGDALAETLRAAGAEVEVVPGALGFSRAEHAEVVGRLATDGLTTVVDLRLLDHAESADTDGTADGRAVVPPVAALLDAWGSDGSGNARVVLVTRGGHQVAGGAPPVTGHNAAAVLQVVANLEYLNLDCSTVDLDPAADPAAAAEVLAAEIRRPDDVSDVLVAYRGRTRYVRGFTPAELPEEPAFAIREGGTYLITGGLGDVGLILAEHIAKAGAGRLVLTSRGGVPAGPGDRRRDGVEKLRELGVEVITPAVNATDLDGMRQVVADVLAGGRLDGVVHAAAVTDPDTFRALRDVDDEAIELHFGAKVVGARVVETVLSELPDELAPEFCLLLSSTSSILGGITFAAYAASNAALTTVGYRNHARYLAGETRTCWISSSWDTWTITLEHVEVGAAMVKHSMTAEEALAAFDQLLAGPGPWLVVAAGGLDERLPRAVSVSDVVTTGEKFPRPDLPQPYSPAATQTERSLAELWSHLLGVEPVGIKDPFFDLGGNSLLALQMLALVKKRFGVAVPAVALFEAPTVQKLAAILDGEGATDTGMTTAATTVVARPERTEADVDETLIAVVGMAGRFPGASDVDTFWSNLRDGVESISFFSEEELLAAGVSKEELSGPTYVPARPVLAEVGGFDAAFFGLSPRMAALTDPQQRMFLEVCWEALEQAGYVVPEGRGRVGVFGGANISTYLLRNPEVLTNADYSTYEVIMGNDKDALTTTVSYLLDLYGPSVAVQTFCSTSLVATHMAVQSLRAGECEMALAGGVSINVPDKIGHTYEPGGMASPDGHVRTFDAEARGSMFGDGAAVVVLKRLSDALRDGDHVWSVIRGSAMNNDGALKVGYTAPSVVGQSRVVVDALADAGVTGDDISYVECHGTATELGDPIEVAALTRAFGDTADKQFCPLGSVKTNVGHLDRAAGVTGLIKTSLSLANKAIPPTLHFTTPNPKIDFENSPFYVNTELSPWQTRDGKPPRAGVSSLGMGGTNVHVVLEQAPERIKAIPADPDACRRYQVLPVSARNATAVGAACERIGGYLRSTPDTRLLDLAYTLQVGRRTFEHRRVVVADGVEAATAALTGESPASVLGRVDTTDGRQVAFLFSGVGEQYPGLVRELYRREPVFAGVLDECLGVLAGLVSDVDLADLLAGERGGGAG